MKKLVILFFILQISSNNAFAEEFIRLPALVFHYLDHTDKHTHDHGFADFLHEHYSDHHTNEADHDHDHLPFKHSTDGHIHFSIISLLSNTGLNLSLFVNETGKDKFALMDDLIKSQYLGQIWQPPKLS